MRQEIASAIAAFGEDVRNAADWRASREREEAAEKPLPPGQIVWREGASYIVQEDGSLSEIAR